MSPFYNSYVLEQHFCCIYLEPIQGLCIRRDFFVFGSPHPLLRAGSPVGADLNPNVLELSMKSEYRQAVESVIAQEMKLAEVTKLHADAAAREKQLTEALRFNQEALEQCERRVAELEPANKGAEELQSQIGEINASLKFLCRELMRPEA